MSLAYIREAYNVPAFRGRRVRFDIGLGLHREGVITGSKNAYLRVRFDPERDIRLMHPTWSLTYLEPDVDRYTIDTEKLIEPDGPIPLIGLA